jgi:uncharacterized membrane protein (UPF0127 family)
MTTRNIIHQETGRVLVAHAQWCDSFLTKLKGFMFHPQLLESEGLVLVDKQDNRLSTSIHMFFVKFDLGVLWVNSAGEVVDMVVAKPWKPNYSPQAPARYVIELHPSLLPLVKIGDHIRFE